MMKSVDILTTPNLVGRPSAVFMKEDFDALVHQKGLDIVIEKAVRCPCKTKNNEHLSTCKNCRGTGWVFINPVKGRAVVSSINSNTQFKDWSEERIGTVTVTGRLGVDLSFMDKITIEDSLAVQSQVLYPFVFESNYFAYTIYNIEDVIEVFKFVSSTNKLEKLTEGIDFTVSGNKIMFIYSSVVNVSALKAVTGYTNNDKKLVSSVGIFKFDSSSTATPDDVLVIKPSNITLPAAGRWVKQDDFTVSIRYVHKLMYYIIDIPHIVRNSYRKPAPTGREELQLLPMEAIARLAHYVIDSQNFTGDNILDNSY